MQIPNDYKYKYKFLPRALQMFRDTSLLTVLLKCFFVYNSSETPHSDV